MNVRVRCTERSAREIPTNWYVSVYVSKREYVSDAARIAAHQPVRVCSVAAGTGRRGGASTGAGGGNATARFIPR